VKSIKIVFSAAICLSAYTLLYAGTVSMMVYDWRIDPNYSHGFLIPIMSGYFLWQRRGVLPAPQQGGAIPGLCTVLVGLGIFILGHLSGEFFTMRFSLLVVLAGTVTYAAGLGFLRAIAFPLGFLLFMIPLPYLIYNSFAFPLKLFVSQVSVTILQVLGYTVLREGNIISFPSTTLEVADACSGMRSIISLLALAAAAAYLSLKGWRRKVVLVALAVPIAVAVNAFRVIVTGMLANRYGARAAQGFYHEFAGLVIFGAAILLLGAAAWLLSRFGTVRSGALPVA
jgi:exosortase